MVNFDALLGLFLGHKHKEHVLKAGDTMTGALTIQGSSDVNQLVVKGNSTQTNNLVQIRDGSNNLVGFIDNAGQFTINVQSGNANYYLTAITGDRSQFQLTGNNASNAGDYLLVAMRTDIPDTVASVYDASSATFHQFFTFQYLNNRLLFLANTINASYSSYNTPLNAVALNLVNQDDSDNATPSSVDIQLRFNSGTYTEAAGKHAKISAIRPTTDFAATVDLAFYTSPTNSSTTERMRILANGNIKILNLISTYNNITTVSNGVPSELAKIDSTGLTANVGATLLYTTPASGAGMYRVSVLVVETTAGSLSSTLPNVQIVYTDNETGGAITIDATPILGIAGIGQTGALTADTVGTTSTGVICINAKASTNINYQTVNYASNLAGMAYALHIKLEAL